MFNCVGEELKTIGVAAVHYNVPKDQAYYLLHNRVEVQANL
jgi:hypothetical protein